MLIVCRLARMCSMRQVRAIKMINNLLSVTYVTGRVGEFSIRSRMLNLELRRKINPKLRKGCTY